jgi:hypothetical protein
MKNAGDAAAEGAPLATQAEYQLYCTFASPRAIRLGENTLSR